MQKSEYAIGVIKLKNGPKPTPFLFKVTGKSGNIVTGVLEKNCHIQSLRTTIEVATKDIIVNLGLNPHPGKAYGCDVSNLYSGRKEHDHFGTLHFFYKPDPDVGAALFSAYNKVYKVLKHNQLEFIVDPITCIWEVLPFHGEKYAGMYGRSRKPELRPHTLQIRPEIIPATEYPYVIYHELAHHLHAEYATGKKLNAAWIRAYNTSIKVEDIKREKSQELLNLLLAQEDRPSDFKSNLSEEDTVTYKWILRTIQRKHSLSIKELDLLFEAQYFDDIKEVWPVRGMSKTDLAPIVTEYGCKNYKELIAESIAYRLLGKKLPKTIEALVDKTFSYARANADKR
jgi:hypothetical protein